MSFTHLHVHSASSPYWGLHSSTALCRAVRRMGMQRLALTDRNGLTAFRTFSPQRDRSASRR
ncbi:MAG: PHP domain-containing protein [Syntrophotaleaceae bacterium]